MESSGQAGGTVSIGLQTPGKELRTLLEKSGARQKTSGAEKLDFLVWLADQVTYSVENGRKMNLAVGELAALLRREGAAPPGGGADAKSAISGLLALRRREITRLDYGGSRACEVASGDQCFELALANMPDQQVDRCFALAVPEVEAAEEDDLETEVLPGSVHEEETNPLRAGANARTGNYVDASGLLPPPPPSRPPPEAPGAEPKVPGAPRASGSRDQEEALAPRQKKCCAVM